MKVLHVTTDFSSGGASKAAQRITQAVGSVGVDAKLLVKWGQNLESFALVTQIDHASLNPNLDSELENIQKYYIKANRAPGWNTYYSFGYPGVDISLHPEVLAADVINLHWVSHFLPPTVIKKLLQLGKPVVWTMHDERPFTGGAHYSYKSEQFRDPLMEDDDQLRDDPFKISRLNMLDQKELFAARNLTLVSPSDWLAEQARNSYVMKGKRVEVILNAHQTQTFYPRHKQDSRYEFGIPQDAKVILFAAHNTDERRKGFLEAKLAVEKLAEMPEIKTLLEQKKLLLMVVGSASSEAQNLPIPVIETGLIKDEEKLAKVYSAADVMLFPPLSENFSNMMCEAMACGVPLVAFDIGGNSNAVKDGENGFLVAKQDTSAMAEATAKLLLDEDVWLKFSTSAALWVKQNLNYQKIGQEYRGLYEDLVAKNGVGERHKQVPQSPMDYSFGPNMGQKIAEIVSYTSLTYAGQIAAEQTEKVDRGVISAKRRLVSLLPHRLKVIIKKIIRR